ncbi:unnamed protein product [Amoebophrya sp. A120]|nr:unnamed protein product [Amoebophrya sp. A120]|eukprot:GSA120T00015197001.1
MLGLGGTTKSALLEAKDSGVVSLILSDPQLQADLLKDPQSALQNNKKLQEAVMKDPEMQKIAKDNAQNLLQDPRVKDFLKEQAKNAAGKAMQALRGSAVKGLEAFKKYVQAGPAGIQMLCFLSGCFTLVIGVLGVINLFSAIESPFTFVMNIYVLTFGLVALIVEADEERLSETPLLEYVAPKILVAQELLHVEAKFLTLLWGRGLFYVFVGLLMATQCWLCFFFLAGAANVTVGVLCLLTHFGVDIDIDYMSRQAGTAYDKISTVTDADAAQFGRAAEAWAKSSSSGDKLCKALHKQATEGDVTGERPTGMFNATAKSEYDARQKLIGMATTDAKREFVAYALQHKYLLHLHTWTCMEYFMNYIMRNKNGGKIVQPKLYCNAVPI